MLHTMCVVKNVVKNDVYSNYHLKGLTFSPANKKMEQVITESVSSHDRVIGEVRLVQIPEHKIQFVAIRVIPFTVGFRAQQHDLAGCTQGLQALFSHIAGCICVVVV